MENLHKRLRELRGNESQTEFAKRVGTKQTTYSAWERGEKIPPANSIALICEACGVSADWLLGLPEHGVSISNSSNNAVNSDNASIQVDSPSCRDCPHLLRLIDILERQGGALSTANVSR